MKKLYLLSLAPILALFSQTVMTSQFQSNESIEAVTRDFLAAKITHIKDYQIIIDPLDRRLKLSECNNPLQAFTQSDRIKFGRFSVGIRCTTENSWTIYNSAKIIAYEKIITLKQPIRRGEIITRTHLAHEKIELSRVRQGFFTDFSQIINQQATRYLPTGTVLTPKHLTTPRLIRRGEKVTISAKSKQIDIQMTGFALMDGTKGQRIRVRNEKSQRIIEATVIQPGLVVVSY